MSKLAKRAFITIPCALLMRHTPDSEQWQEMSYHLLSTYRSIYWQIGDFIKYGEAQIGDEIYQYLEGFSLDLLERCALVARAYPVDERFDELSFSHHHAALSVRPEFRKSVLSMAVMNGWGVDDTRKYCKSLKSA